VFGKIFNDGTEFACDGSQFDQLVADGDQLMIGEIPPIDLHVPGHTPADLAYVVGDAAFIGDTMFMPDYGSARADFPGGGAPVARNGFTMPPRAGSPLQARTGELPTRSLSGGGKLNEGRATHG
jgi:hypothetical protein